MRAPLSLLSGLLLAAALLAGAPARAGDDHDRAREALRDGRILPLERIAALAKQRFGGDILDVELEDEDDGFRYELKLIAGDGRIMKLEYDAATGELLRAKARDRKPERR
ncbi:putative membrane protein YkoI [Azospirillum agricola]|uniref:PepSY domain-containing protein n=1 Tax=Azospirillum agricola TaxID=1720247 RepID=UPI001AE9A88C|nr:PepSY domain-containing protein [Azospirillum agricola]MBP2229449.1 putative membrane protein YkoI [Azospirillum agricola]